MSHSSWFSCCPRSLCLCSSALVFPDSEWGASLSCRPPQPEATLPNLRPCLEPTTSTPARRKPRTVSGRWDWSLWQIKGNRRSDISSWWTRRRRWKICGCVYQPSADTHKSGVQSAATNLSTQLAHWSLDASASHPEFWRPHSFSANRQTAEF